MRCEHHQDMVGAYDCAGDPAGVFNPPFVNDEGTIFPHMRGGTPAFETSGADEVPRRYRLVKNILTVVPPLAEVSE